MHPSFKLIAKGSDSEIFLYDNTVVLKMVDVVMKKQIGHLQNEFQIMKTLDHPNVLKVIGLKNNIPIKSISDPTSNCRRNVLQMEFAEQGSMLTLLKRGLQPQLKKSIVVQLVEAFYYLHYSQKVAHRDIKLDNILARKVANGSVVPLISDFGFAVRNPNEEQQKVEEGKKVQEKSRSKTPRQKSVKKTLKGEKATSQASEAELPKPKPFLVNSYKGTKRAYMAPELHKLIDEPKPYDPFKADVFSFGVVLFCLLFQKLPFELSSGKDPIYGWISKGKWVEFWAKHKLDEQKYSDINLEELKTLLEGMLQEYPEKRITMKQVYESNFFKAVQLEESLNSSNFTTANSEI